MQDTTGKVYLVGAGPGDPGLITLKGKECIERADVIVYDYLAASSLLAYARKDTQRIYVGKKGGHHTLSQHAINQLLVEKAKSGLTVARLKGGDPFIFGRGGEEIEVLVAADIPFEVVPGISSAVAAPAYAGIPLTHRKYTSTLAFVTGHEDPQKETSSIDWRALASGIGTLVFLMGVKNLKNIVQQLVKHELSPQTPVALIRWGTTPRQTTLIGTLANIVQKAEKSGINAPAIIVVGDVVGLRQTMQWFENRPLMGKRIVVTRAREQSSDLLKLLSEAGAECLQCPTIKVEAPLDCGPMDVAIQKIAQYDWLVFTSVNGVGFFFERLFYLGQDVRALGNARIACIGPATRGRLEDFGLICDIMPETYRAESIVEAFQQQPLKDKKILLPRAKEARPILPLELSKMGAQVDEVMAYITKLSDENRTALLAGLGNRSIDCVTFTSSSTVRNFKQLIPADAIERLLNNVTVACIGPVTADTATSLGFQVHIVAENYTIPGLRDTIVQYYTGKE